VLPKLTCVEEIGICCMIMIMMMMMMRLSSIHLLLLHAPTGVASGLLNTALAKVTIQEDPQIPPYYKLFEVHHAMNRYV
jgi:hypothetical protein